MKGSQMSIPRQTAKGHPHCALMAAAFAFAALFIAPLGDRAVFGQCSYSYVEIAPSPCQFGGPPPLSGLGLNALGQVVGQYRDCADTTLWHAFFWSEDTGLITLPKPDGATSMSARDLNDHQQIVGQVLFPGVAWRGYTYDMNTGEFQFLESKHGVGSNEANAINNAGIVAGSRSISKSGSTPYNAVIWDTNTGEVIDLGLWGVGPNSTARDIDDDTDEIVGWTGQSTSSSSNGVIQLGEKFLLLDPVPGTDTSHASYRNRNRLVTGSGANTQQFVWRGFVWDGAFEVLAPPPGFNSTSTGSINDIGQALVLCSATGGFWRPYLWQHGEMLDINDLVENADMTFDRPSDINSVGQILLRAGARAALLTPIDVPRGDLNYDCAVDVHDLRIMFEQWGPVPRSQTLNGVPSADLNGDGVVDVADLLILFDHWTN
jgi:hypothetical protein